MFTALLVIIYIAFISLGLPDSLLGSAWPVMHMDLGAPLSFAGVISMIVSCGTVVSSLLSTRLIARFGTARVTVVSVAMTAAALLGFGVAPAVWWLCLLAVPLGLGAGSVDAGLNNFVALHYKANHMSWLHCFWGIGATAGPMVMAFWLNRDGNWHGGYLTIGLLQAVLVAVLLCSMPLWRKVSAASKVPGEEEPVTALPLRKVFQIPRAKAALLGFFCYCAVETTANLWASSYAVTGFGVDEHTAAGWSSVFFLGITLGRLLSGFVAMRLSSPRLNPRRPGADSGGDSPAGPSPAPVAHSRWAVPDWRRLRAHLSRHAPPNAPGLWQAAVSGHDGGANGLRLCGYHADASRLWAAGLLGGHPAVPPVFAGVSGADVSGDPAGAERRPSSLFPKGSLTAFLAAALRNWIDKGTGQDV